MNVWADLGRAWHYLVLALGLLLSVWASGHALAYKRDPRAATLWIVIVWLFPLVGAVLYFLFGVNRIQRWAASLRADVTRLQAHPAGAVCAPEELPEAFPDGALDLEGLARAVGQVTSRPLLRGNRITPLVDGDEAFPAMLGAIAAAKRSVTLSTYIFDADEVGCAFARALGEAVRRGVEVRVLVDATGARYSWPSIFRALRREKVPYARFLRLLPIARLLAMNLRNHRKIMVVDGDLGFTGGMNIRVGHWLGKNSRRPVRDIHFRVEGPITGRLQEVFGEDWHFTTGEALRGELWFPPPAEAGPSVVRGISDGPDEDFDQLRWTILTALTAARCSIRVATPYFLPEPSLVAALNVAAMRGLSVDILLPSRSNLPLVHSASRAHWWQVLKHGCRIWLTPPPFDHSKLLIIDDAWCLVGSANWDPRSLRLNFEFNIECYDPELAKQLAQAFDLRRASAQQVTLKHVDDRSLPVRLFDGAARLLTPFL